MNAKYVRCFGCAKDSIVVGEAKSCPYCASKEIDIMDELPIQVFSSSDSFLEKKPVYREALAIEC